MSALTLSRDAASAFFLLFMFQLNLHLGNSKLYVFLYKFQIFCMCNIYGFLGFFFTVYYVTSKAETHVILHRKGLPS